jgi:hypothetical protein
MRFRILSSTFRRRPLSGLLAALTLVAMLTTQTGVFARLQASPTAPSPARGHAAVIAQGVAAMPFDPIAWRVVADTAEPLAGASAVERALGFVVTTTDGVNLADETAGTQERLAPGEAAFVPEGAIQIRASLTDQNVPYLRVGLVGADDANDPGNDTLVFGGKAFDAPSGQRDIDLVRDVLGDGEQSEIPGSDFPILVIATSGSISVDDGSGNPVTLGAGEATELSGDLTITGAGDSSSYVAGVIGPEVPVPPRTTGSVTLGVYLCAPGVTPDDLGSPVAVSVASECDTVTDGVATTLTGPDGSTLTLDDASSDEGGLFAWTDLPFGDYTVASPTDLPAGAGSPTFVDADGNVVGDGSLSIDASSPDAHLDLYLFQSAATSGSIAVTVYDCPNGVGADVASPQACQVAASPGDLTLTAADGTSLALSDATQNASSYVWSGLGLSADNSDAGNYGLQATNPDGFGSMAADGATAGDQSGAFSITLTADAPNATVDLYNLVEASGTITLDTIVCPDGADNPDTCVREFGPSGLTGVSIQDAANDPPFTEADASVVGDGPYVWANVPLGDYGMDTSGLVPPDGYQIEAVVLTPDGADASNGFTISADLPIANIVVLLKPVDTGGGGDEGTPTAEATDAGAPSADTDGDCHTDDAETAAGTDPNDPNSVPAGDCDAVTGAD